MKQKIMRNTVYSITKKLLSNFTALVMVISIFLMPISVWADVDTKYDNEVIESNIETIKNYVKENGQLDSNGNFEFKYDLSKVVQVNSSAQSLAYINLSDKDKLVFRVELGGMNEDNTLCDYAISTMEIPSVEDESFYLDLYYYIWLQGFGDDSLNAHTYLSRDYDMFSTPAKYIIDKNISLPIDFNEEEIKLLGDSALSSWYIMLNELFNMNLDSIGFHSYCREHTYKNVITDSTCTQQGYTTYICTICGITYVSEYTECLKHKEIVIPSVNPTCTATGKTEGSHCSLCGEVIVAQNTIDPLGHTLKTTTTAATYAKAGKQETKCTECGKVTVTKVLPKLVVPATTLSKVTTPKSKQLKVTWKKNTKVTGYEVQYSTDKNFKKGNKIVTVSKNSTTSTTIKKLKSKKKYYVRIRTYKTVNGKKYYSAWSKAKNVKVK